ncbi:hypothetical protein WDV86_04920, partial [Pseudokineococcus sp. 1T1Z-3]|uniref:hypothetical protein n=1 Tax=Pseudokineococcus sp. 1T1Z-3 TaxID=3132745 RepID=UPI00309639D5
TGLLGLVATGRSAGAAAMAGDNGADAATYVLAVPHALALVASADRAREHARPATPPKGVDEVGTPTRVAVSVGDPRAGARAKPTSSAAKRPLAVWPESQRPATKPEMAAAAATA